MCVILHYDITISSPYGQETNIIFYLSAWYITDGRVPGASFTQSFQIALKIVQTFIFRPDFTYKIDVKIFNEFFLYLYQSL